MRPINNDSSPILQLWLSDMPPDSGATIYSPALFIECKLSYRSLRAGAHHNEERIYTVWYPEGDLPVDWDCPAKELEAGTKFSAAAPVELPKRSGNFKFAAEKLMELQEELIGRLIRTEKLRLIYNPAFKIYSSPDEDREEFLSRVSEFGLNSMEQELKELMRRFEMRFEQVREAEERKGRKTPLPELDLLKSIEQRSELHTSKSRMTEMFLNSAKHLLKPKRQSAEVGFSLENANFELHETLCLIEQEAKEALSALCDDFLEKAAQCDNFDIGLQRNNIQVLRRAVLWLPQ